MSNKKKSPNGTLAAAAEQTIRPEYTLEEVQLIINVLNSVQFAGNKESLRGTIAIADAVIAKTVAAAEIQNEAQSALGD